MSEIRFYAPDVPNFEQANMLAKLAMEQRQKTADGFKDTAKGFTDAVVKSNHSLIKEQLDALTPEQLQDKVAVNALVNSLTKDTGYMYDAPVVDAYVEARPDILQQRALEAEKLKQQELANQNSAFNIRANQLEQDKKARDEMRQDLLSQYIYYSTQEDKDDIAKASRLNSLKGILANGKDLFNSENEMYSFLGLGLTKHLNEQNLSELDKAKVQAQIDAVYGNLKISQQNADTNEYKAVNDNQNTQTEQALKAFGIANKDSGGGNGGSKDSNGGKQQDLIQKTATENSLKKLNELGMPNAVEQKEDGSLGVNYNTVNSTIQNTMSNINEKYRESASEWEEKLSTSEYMQDMGSKLFSTKKGELKTFVDSYETTDENGNKRLLRADEKEEIYRKATLGDIRFAEWTGIGKGDTLHAGKIEPYLKQYNNEITKKANAEITAHVADTLSALSQATGMANGQLAYELGWGKGTDMFKQLPESLQKDLVKYDTQQNTKRLLGKSPMTGTNGNMLNTAVNQSKNRKVTVNGKDWLVPSTLAKLPNKKSYADIPLGKYRNRYNH